MSYSPPTSIQPYALRIPDEELSEWRQLLQLSKLGPKTYENHQTEHSYGVTYQWLSDAKDHWLNAYDWRTQEKHINSFPNYKTQIEDIDLHFVALFSDKKDAVPILFMHGWPGSFVEFLPMCGLIREKYKAGEQPYHIIVPSLPGYTLSSSGPQHKDWTMQDTGRIMDKLMQNLGFGKYIVQGGDVGSLVGTIMANTYDSCVGLHLNMMSTSREVPDEDSLSALEKDSLRRAQEWRMTGIAYAQEQSSRPSTIGHVLSSNPLALLSWIGEKFLDWSDQSPPLDTILTNVSLYWFTESFPRSIYPYRQLFTNTRLAALEQYIQTPTGFSCFPDEILLGAKCVVEKACNLVYYRQHESGGHFAALEKPEVLWADVEGFVNAVWER